MKRYFSACLLILGACGTPTETVDSLYYVEKRLGFYDPSNEDFSLTEWIRKPENLQTLQETLKKYGYANVFSDFDLNSNTCMIWSYINKPCSTLIDSLIITYSQADKSPKYYREFWSRRRAEQNDTAVYAVLTEIKYELIDKTRVAFNDELVNDTIYSLLRIKFRQPGSEEEATDNFDYLTRIGLNLSAYNLLYESYWYQDFKWDKDKLKEKLKVDTTYCCPSPLIVDDTK